MIRYALACEAGHGFESWFRDSAAYEQQATAGLLACPFCGSGKIAKQIMAPAIAQPQETGAPGMTGPASPAQTDSDAERRAAIRALYAELRKSAENVGERFAEEARRMHAGESEERAIYGGASLAEVKSLHEEGIPVMPLPVSPDDTQ